MVLVGGKGTRLRPLTTDIPKPVLTLVDRPFLSYMIEWLASHGVDDIVFACGFLPDQLEEVLGNGGVDGPRLSYVVEPEAFGTAGAIKFAEDHLEDRFFALNGDVLTDLDLTSLWNSHTERGASASLGLYPVDDPTGYGLVDLDEGGHVLDFHEKPEPGHAGAGLINAGTYVLDKSVLESVAPGQKVSIEREVFPALVGNGLFGLRLDGYWKDIGLPDRFSEACWDIIEGRVMTAVETNQEGIFIGKDCEIDPGARVGPRAVIGDRSKIASGAEVNGSVLISDCEIGEDASVRDSILSSGVKVASNSRVGDAVLGKNEVVR
ncbi:MAG: NDP-sugar synthase [Solirubrobacterales bacterium]|nr:NDP-sugar synthase [Solirubrobacterales bacterium]